MKGKELKPVKTDAPIICKNCDTSFKGNYCPECGQSKKDYDKPFRFIIFDFAGTLFAFDTRVWKTIKTLLLKPGRLAEDITRGKRARYMPPFRLYVFVSFIFFLLLNITSGKVVKLIEGDTDFGESFITLESENDSISMNDALKDSVSMIKTFSIGSENTSLQDILKHKEMYISKFLSGFSYSLFLLMPLYGLLLWLFFKRTHPHYFAHLVLAINQHIVTFMLLSFIMLIHLIFPNKSAMPENYLLLALPVYIALGVRKMYRRKWPVSLFRITLVSLIYVFALTTNLVIIILNFTFNV